MDRVKRFIIFGYVVFLTVHVDKCHGFKRDLSRVAISLLPIPFKRNERFTFRSVSKIAIIRF
jgi:hypothetical protein